MPRNRRYGILAVVLLMGLLLSGCIHVRQEITLQADENWKAVMSITFPKSTVDQIGEEQMTSTQTDFEAQKEEAAKKGLKADLKISKNDAGDVIYDITFEGKGLALLNETVFSDAAELAVSEGDRVKFRYDPGDITSMTSMGGSYTFVLKAGKVYSSNATETKGNTLTWKDPTAPLEAEVGTAGGGAAGVGLIIGLVVGGIVLLALVAAVLLYLRGRSMQKAAAPAAPVAPPSEPPAPPQP